MKYTIIGGNGFIGKKIAIYFKNKGYEVFVPARNDQTFLNQDLGNIFYCAGYTSDFYVDPVATMDAHAFLLSRLLRSSTFRSLIYLSSTRLYDGLPPASVAKESSSFNISPENPRHLFDISKLAGESLCLLTNNNKVKIARLGCVYNDHLDSAGFLSMLLNEIAKAKRGDILNISSSPNYSRDYVYLPDVLIGLEKILNYGKERIYNIASGENISNRFIRDLVNSHSGRFIKFNSNALISEGIQINIDRMKNEFNWSPSSLSSNIIPWLKKI